MELIVSSLYVGRSVNFRRSGFPRHPTVTAADVAYGSDLVLTGPDPSRIKLDLWWPDWAGDTRPKLRDPVRLTVTSTDNGATTGFASAVAFLGRVDGVDRLRRHAPASETAKRQAPPVRLTRTARTYYDPSITLDHVSIVWWQDGVDKLYGIVRADDVWRMPQAPEDNGDGLIHPTNPIHAVIPIHPLDVPDDAILYASEILDRAGATKTGWRWRVNGVLGAFVFGGAPLRLNGPAPADLALVSPSVSPGGFVADLDAPVISVGRSRGIRPAGEWITVTASDLLSEAGRMKIGAPPFPSESPSARWSRVAALAETVDIPVRSQGAWNFVGDSRLPADSTAGLLAPADVDNRPVGELLREASSGVGAVPMAHSTGLVPWRARRLPNVLTAAGTVQRHPETVTIPPGVVSEPVLKIRSVDVTNRVSAGYVDQADGTTERRVTVSWPDSIKRWGEHSTSWATKMLAAANNPRAASGLGPLLDRLTNAVSAMSQPAYRFSAPIVLTPSRLAKIPDGTDIRALYDVDRRHGMPLAIDHEIPDAPTTYTLRGGSLVIEEGRVILTLDPEPAGHSGAPGLIFAALASALPDLTFATVDQSLTFQQTTAIGVPE